MRAIDTQTQTSEVRELRARLAEAEAAMAEAPKNSTPRLGNPPAAVQPRKENPFPKHHGGGRGRDSERALRVYVAGSSAELDRAARAMEQVRRVEGLELVSDWVADIRAAGTANEGLSWAESRDYAEAARAAVRTADALWLLVPQGATSFGAGFESGVADSHGLFTVASVGRRFDASIFHTLFTAVVEEDDEVEAVLLQRRRWRS